MAVAGTAAVAAIAGILAAVMVSEVGAEVSVEEETMVSVAASAVAITALAVSAA